MRKHLNIRQHRLKIDSQFVSTENKNVHDFRFLGFDILLSSSLLTTTTDEKIFQANNIRLLLTTTTTDNR
ncbi:hypothetical protein DERP_012791 [Dermatophagoides pteronyssinus]|uniref:Uncharacterized protein n=1 Tax=Dermatophagoides pteronyssinus TaxID=6956 RepID=A0ABQ8JFL3_DERPT|nr:hypothetical protein DERP_012791 [Dermatophagoides pteronyssinus]